MIKIYGSPRSSAGRCFSMLEEVGVPYEIAPMDMSKKEHKSAEFMKLNPNGKVPCLVDGNFVIWESLAINSYLAEKYKPELLGKTIEERALVNQWSIWGLVELQPPFVDILIQNFFVPEGKKDLALIEKRREQIPAKLEILNQSLQGKEYLVGDRYTMADLNLASMVGVAFAIQFDISSFKNIGAWLERIHARPAMRKLMEISKH